MGATTTICWRWLPTWRASAEQHRDAARVHELEPGHVHDHAAGRARHRLGDLLAGGLGHRDVELSGKARDDHVVPLLDLHLSQVVQEASPPRCPSRRLRLTVVPCSPGCTATVSISVRIRSSPLPWSSSRSERQLPRSCTAISITVPSRWPDTSNRAPFVVPACSIAFVAASPHAVVISAISRSSAPACAEPAAQHAADRRERLRLRGELGAELLGHREVEERQERHVVRRPAGRDQRGEQVVEQALRVVRARRAPSPRARSRPLSRCSPGRSTSPSV